MANSIAESEQSEVMDTRVAQTTGEQQTQVQIQEAELTEPAHQVLHRESEELLVKISQTVFRRIPSSSFLKKLLTKKPKISDSASNQLAIKKNQRKGIASAHMPRDDAPRSNEIRHKRNNVPEEDCLTVRSAGNASEMRADVNLSLVIPASKEDDSTCIVCCESQCDAVFMPCGHGGICISCALFIFEQTESRCTMCRQVTYNK